MQLFKLPLIFLRTRRKKEISHVSEHILTPVYVRLAPTGKRSAGKSGVNSYDLTHHTSNQPKQTANKPATRKLMSGISGSFFAISTI